ncbi:hypothetical protein [Rheinheimera sp. WS51]|uniref:hypothetical protein n=1 Tax=Rheinheimera sp. WS51 TaxID=3425886 RepID=UPI003D931AA5
MSTLNTTVNKSVQNLGATNAVSRQIQMRKINRFLGQVGKALSLSSMVNTK